MAKKGSKRSEAKAAKAQREYWYNVYFKVLKAHDVNVKQVKRITKASVESLKKKYTKLAKTEGLEGIRQEYRTVVAKEQSEADWRAQERTEDYRTTETPTIDVYQQVIDDFLAVVENVYRETLEYIASANDKLSNIANSQGNPIIDKLTEQRDKIYQKVYEMEQSVGNTQIVAELISENVDLDYSIAISLVPPSGVSTENFELTYQQLNSIWDKVVAEAQEREERGTYY